MLKWPGAIAEISRYTLAKNFRHIDPSKARVILIEGAPRLLAAYPPDLSRERAEAIGRAGRGRAHGRASNEHYRSRRASERRIYPMPREDLGGRQ